MPVNDWSTDAAAADRTDQDLAAARAANREAKYLLGELHDAITSLGDAFSKAGFAASAWRSSGARLDELGDQFPAVTLDALFSRMAEFTADSGPAWLAGDGEALDDFEHEVVVLADAMRPLRVLAQRQRLRSPAKRGRMPLEQALGDGRVGAQLDRVVRTLRLLEELAPQLEPVAPEPVAPVLASAPAFVAGPDDILAGHGDAAMAAPGNPLPAGADKPAGRDIPAGAKALGAAFLARMGSLRLGRWPGGRVWAGLPRRTRLAAVAAALVVGLSLSGVLALARFGGPRTTAHATQTASSSQAGTGARGQATAARTATSVAAAATAMPVPARLAVSPTNVILTCTGTSVALTLSDTGGQPLSWQASAPSYVVLSATSGSLGPHSSTVVTARANAPHHGSSAITFKANGASVTVSVRVSCH